MPYDESERRLRSDLWDMAKDKRVGWRRHMLFVFGILALLAWIATCAVFVKTAAVLWVLTAVSFLLIPKSVRSRVHKG